MDTGLIPYKDFFVNYSEAILIANDKNEPLFVNMEFKRLTGLTDRDVSSFNVEHLLQPDKTKDKENGHWGNNFTKKNGELLPVKVSVSPVTLSDSSIGKIYTITSYPHTNQLNDLLVESENRFKALADSSPAMIRLADKYLNAFYFNKAWLEFTGKKMEEEVGKGWLKNIHPDDMVVLDKLRPVIEKKESYACEYRLHRHDGVYRNIYGIGAPRFLQDGSFAGYMCNCLDITEMKEAMKALAHHEKEIKRINEELEQFAYVTSHDLQEPLRMIVSYIQLIQKNMERGNTQSINEFMSFVLDGVNRMQALISDLLQFSRVNRKGTPFTTVKLNEVLNIAMTHLSGEIKKSGAAITFEDMPCVTGDTFQLVRLFQNLIDNSIKFKSPDRNPEITISVKERGKDYLFAFKDNGIGIDNKFYTRIFVIFQRLHTRNQYEGTGMGLAICKKIVERHGGEIWVESEPGKGSAFYFTIKK